MKYITGIHALNIPCTLDTCGDWHQSALAWKNIQYGYTEKSMLGNYGIEYNKEIPEHSGRYAVANHIRALLDLLIQGNFAVAQGMREDFICNEAYTQEIFLQVYSIISRVPKDLASKIDGFMGKEYMMDWVNFKRS